VGPAPAHMVPYYFTIFVSGAAIPKGNRQLLGVLVAAQSAIQQQYGNSKSQIFIFSVT
jgi:hypothetical protein